MTIHSMDRLRQYEQKLSEACNNGDDELVLMYIEKGVDVNSQNTVNGWTPLHWASKRGHERILVHLLNGGADKNIQNTLGELPLDVATKESVRILLGGEPIPEDHIEPEQRSISFTPNYLANPPFPYTSKPDQMPVHSHTSMNSSHSDMHHQGAGHTANSLSHSTSQGEESELVLKARIANVTETDFIEIELDKRKLTYDNLLTLMCKELTASAELVQKIRKLPDTIVRKDKDVKRLHDFQELELVLTNRAMSESSRGYTSSVSPKHVDVVY